MKRPLFAVLVVGAVLAGLEGLAQVLEPGTMERSIPTPAPAMNSRKSRGRCSRAMAAAWRFMVSIPLVLPASQFVTAVATPTPMKLLKL